MEEYLGTVSLLVDIAYKFHLPINQFFFSDRPPNALDAFERLFYALFGLTKPEDLRMIPENLEPWTEEFFKLIFGLYLLMAAIVLINLLIAMMSDTYQRVQV